MSFSSEQERFTTRVPLYKTVSPLGCHCTRISAKTHEIIGFGLDVFEDLLGASFVLVLVWMVLETHVAIDLFLEVERRLIEEIHDVVNAAFASLRQRCIARWRHGECTKARREMSGPAVPAAAVAALCPLPTSTTAKRVTVPRVKPFGASLSLA